MLYHKINDIIKRRVVIKFHAAYILHRQPLLSMPAKKRPSTTISITKSVSNTKIKDAYHKESQSRGITAQRSASRIEQQSSISTISKLEVRVRSSRSFSPIDIFNKHSPSEKKLLPITAVSSKKLKSAKYLPSLSPKQKLNHSISGVIVLNKLRVKSKKRIEKRLDLYKNQKAVCVYE